MVSSISEPVGNIRTGIAGYLLPLCFSLYFPIHANPPSQVAKWSGPYSSAVGTVPLSVNIQAGNKELQGLLLTT